MALGPAYPVNLLVAGRPCLVVGEGPVAQEKVDGLADAGADVTLVAAADYEDGAVAGYRLVVTATEDAAVTARVHADAEAAGVWMNAADDPEHCSFTLPAQVRRGDLLLTASTSGRSPAVAAWVRERLEAEYGSEWATLLDLVADARDDIRRSGRSAWDVDWRAALDSEMLELVREGRVSEAKERLQACLSSSSD